MRLIKVDTLEMQQFFGADIPPYAILSHRWGAGDDEVSLSDMRNGLTRKPGMVKVRGCCNQAQKDRIDYVWIDTCCINKESSKELDEAINSMFQWYRKASVGYTYLSDVPNGDDVWDPASNFYSSSWFQRGWTLQELLAPVESRFYDQAWNFIGTKADLSSEIEIITDIPRKFLLGWVDFHQASVAQRMSWAAKRETKREEDMAYCLLGIFNVTMPMIYGEGGKAFERLQLKIMEQTTDDSLLAWGTYEGDLQKKNATEVEIISAGVFASSPKDFSRCGRIVPHTQDSKSSSTFTVSGGYVHTSLTLHHKESKITYAALNCCFEGNDLQAIAIPLCSMSSANGYIRPQSHGPILVEKPPVEEVSQKIRIRVERQVRPIQTAGTSVWLHVQGYQKLELKLAETYPLLHWERSRALLACKDDSKSKVNTQLLRFTSDVAESHDLVVVIELNPSDVASNTRSFIIQAFRDLDLRDLENSLEFIDPRSRHARVADNGVMEVTVTLTQEAVPQGVVCLVSLARTDRVPVVANKRPASVTAKLKHDFMDSLRKESLAKSAEDPALKNLTAWQHRRDSAEATIREIEEEERKLADRKQLLRKEMKSIADRIVVGEAEMKGRLESYNKYRRKRLKFQDILDGKTTPSHGHSKSPPQFILSKGEVVHGPGNWFEQIIQRRLEKVPEKSYAWPVEVGQHTKDLSPLLWAVANTKVEFASLLLEKGSDTEVKDKYGTTGLSAAAYHGKTRIVEMLLAHGAQLEASNERRLTPLIYACYGGHQETVILLLDKGANIEARTASGSTALALAALQGHDDVVSLLLERGADIEPKDEDGNTPLAEAASGGHVKTVARLLRRGADIETRNNSQQTPLAIATMKGHEETTKLLLKKGANVESRDCWKTTPMDYAALRGHKSVVKMMLGAGARSYLKEKTGPLPLSAVQ